MFKKPEDISPLPTGMMDAFTKTLDTQLGNYNTAQEAPAPEAPSQEAAIPEEKLEESVEVVEGTLKVTNYSGSDAGGQSPKSQGIKVKKVASGRYGDDVEMTGPDAKLIAFAIANLGVDKSAKTIADAQKQINESKKIASEDDDKELDKVDPKAAKKKFDDREDKDIDNDGDEDDSDEYLHKRRQAIAKALAKKKVEESVELDEESDQLDEYIGGIGRKIKSKIKQKIGGFSKKGDTGSYRSDKTRVKTNDDRRIDDSKERSAYNRLVALHTKVNDMIANNDKAISRRALQRTKSGEKVKQRKNDNFENKAFQQRVKSVRDQIKSIEATVKTTTARAASKAASAKKQNRTESVNEAKFGDNDLVHIAKANVRGNNNPKTDKIIGYSKAPKNPNKFPDPKSGANAIMRIADAKKKGFKVESADLGKPEGFFSEEMNPTDHVRFNKETNMFCVYDKDGKKVYESEKEEEANKYATDNHDALMGKSDLAEIRGKLNAKGEIEMTKANFAKVHKDYKTKIKGQPFAMQIDPKTGGSALFPVKFIKEEVALDEAYQVYVKSRTAKSGWIAQGQPHKTEADAKKDAKSFGGVTKIVKEEVALDEKYQQFTDKTPNWGEDQALTYGRKKGYKEVAVMGDGKGVHAMVLFALNSEDKKFVKGANVKSGESVFRYTTKISIAGDIFPLVKVNIAKGIFYPLTQESSDGSIETAKFETRGVKLKFFRSLEGAKLESIEEAKMKEGNSFTKALAAARLNGDDEFIVSGKKYKVTEHAEELDEAVDSADMDDMKATKGDKESAKMNIIVQLRKAADVKGNLDIVFANGKKQKLPANIIKIALDKFNSFRKPATKEKLVTAMSKSYKDMLNALKTIKEYSE